MDAGWSSRILLPKISYFRPILPSHKALVVRKARAGSSRSALQVAAAAAAVDDSGKGENRWEAAQGQRDVLYSYPELARLQNAEHEPQCDRLTFQIAGVLRVLNAIDPPKPLWRTVAAVVLGGQALKRIAEGM